MSITIETPVILPKPTAQYQSRSANANSAWRDHILSAKTNPDCRPLVG